MEIDREDDELSEPEMTEHDRRAEEAQEDDAPRNGQGQDLTIPGTPADPDNHTR